MYKKQTKMYVTDKKTKQCVCSYIRHKYGAGLEPNRVYVFRYDYVHDGINYVGEDHSVYSVSKYKGYVSNPFPENIDATEVDKWGMILLRKEKINKEKWEQAGSRIGYQLVGNGVVKHSRKK